MYAAAQGHLAALDRHTEQLDRVGAATLQGPPLDRAVADIIGLVEAADSEMERLVLLNTDYAARHARRIEQLWRSATRTEFVLDGICILLACLTGLVAVGALRRARRLLEEKTSELEQFAARVAHDVSSPLSTIGLSLPLLQRRLANDTQLQLLTTRAAASLERVYALVNGILDFARSGARHGGGRADVSEVLAGVIADLDEQAQRARVTLVLDARGGERVACAPGILMSIASNLVRNAILYMGDSAVRSVTVRATARERMVAFEVEDSGPGVVPELHDYIFEPYARVGTSKEPGLGLGLATVKRFVVAHRGAIGVRSERGRGAVFWFELPRAA
jgi:signal transduction histidine kinase